MVPHSGFSFHPTPYWAPAVSLNHTPLWSLCCGCLLPHPSPLSLFPSSEREVLHFAPSTGGNPQSQQRLAALSQSTNILKIFVILLTTGGYNSLLAESKSTSCQRIPETICMILRSKNKMKWFYSHPVLPHIQIHTQTTKLWAFAIRQTSHTTSCLRLPPTPCL